MTAMSLILNGLKVDADVPARTHLADFIRESAGLTGTHLGCEHGICGACTVEVDGEIARSCITLAVACDGASIRTIEGFDSDGLMARLRQAFQEEHALQCGYCTPGMLIAARDLIMRGVAKTETDVRVALSGNLCRCTGYTGIVRAVMRILAEQPAGDLHSSARLGALGPVGSSAIRTSPSALQAAPASGLAAQAMPKPAALLREHVKRVEVRTTAPTEREGMTVLTQSFLLPHSVDATWTAMRDLQTLAACLPGAELTAPLSQNGDFEARIAVALGPLRPSFQGRGRFSVSDTDHSGEISGAGKENRGASQASGRMRFQAWPEGSGTLVSAEIGYKLTGPLAQFARPALVTGIVNEIGATFADNLNAHLLGQGDPRKTGAPSGAKLFVRALWNALMAWLGRRG